MNGKERNSGNNFPAPTPLMSRFSPASLCSCCVPFALFALFLQWHLPVTAGAVGSHGLYPLCARGDVSSLTPLSCHPSLFGPCSVAMGSWLTAGQLWMLALAKGWPCRSLDLWGAGVAEHCCCSLPHGQVLVGRPSPITIRARPDSARESRLLCWPDCSPLSQEA